MKIILSIIIITKLKLYHFTIASLIQREEEQSKDIMLDL